MLDFVALIAAIIAYFGAILFYTISSYKAEGRTRFEECYLITAIGMLAEIIFGGVIALTWQSDVIGYVVPSSQRLETFLGFLQMMAFGFLFMWLDLIRQYLKLRK